MRGLRLLTWCVALSAAAAVPACGGDDDSDVVDGVDWFHEADAPDETPGDDAAEVPPDGEPDETTETLDVDEDEATDVDEDEATDVETADDAGDDGGGEVPFCAEQPDGTSCDDGDPCTTGEACASGVCTGGVATVCVDDGNPCTDDVCDPGTGACVHEPNAAACDDGDWCTVGDACSGGTCAAGTPRDCSAAADLCRTASCDSTAAACLAVPVEDGTPCEDLCRSGGLCSGGVCSGGTVVSCASFDDACNDGVCSPLDGSCSAVPRADGTACDDALACTSGDACTAGVCAGTPADEDGDTYVALGCLTGDDCDDTAAAVHPGAVEGPMGTATCFDGLDNDCDGWSDLADGTCGAGLNWGNLQSPLTMALRVGDTSPTVQGQAYEPGGTEAVGAMPGLTAQLGWGPAASDPTGNPAWTWATVDYWGQGGTGNVNDVFGGTFDAPPPGRYGYTYRYSLDAGATWLYVDSDGNGTAPPSNGLQLERLGALTVVVNDHLLLTEVVVAPGTREFVELHNPTSTPIDLSDYYLTDARDPATSWHYWDLVNGSGALRSWDFVARFPAGATLEPGAYAVVSMGAAAPFRAAFGAAPTFEMCPGSTDDATVPNMRPAWTGSICTSTEPLNNAYETLVLFTWNGTGDLVRDVDILQWGTTAEAVVKTGVSIDGPDPGSTATSYAPDTPAASQTALTPAPHDGGGSFERVLFGETGELRPALANGLTGHDETSEDWTATWALTLAATPGH